MLMKQYLMSSWISFPVKPFDGEKLKVTYDSGDDVPEAFRSLYSEKDGKFHLTGIDGIKTQGDIDRISEALRKERSDHKKLRELVRGAFGNDSPDFTEIKNRLDSVDELQAQIDAAADPKNQKKIDDLVEAKLKAKLAPIERERDELKTRLNERDASIAEFTKEKRARKVQDVVRENATKIKLLPEAMEDAVMYAERLFEEDDSGNLVMRDNVGFTPGVDVAFWLTEMQQKKPHWWAPSEGGGAGGNRGGIKDQIPNPWTRENWNMTEQGRMLRTDRAKAEKMATAAGTKIGGGMPPKKN